MNESKKPIEIKINGIIEEELETFLNLVSIKRLSKNIRKLLMCFLKYEVKDGVDIDFLQLIEDLKLFFELLDLIDAEYDQSELFKDI